jgi:hypothetical protein
VSAVSTYCTFLRRVTTYCLEGASGGRRLRRDVDGLSYHHSFYAWNLRLGPTKHLCYAPLFSRTATTAMIYASLHLVVFLYMEEDNADETRIVYMDHTI